MGRTSLPILNRTGLSMFWDNLWDNYHNFSNIFIENIFIRIIVNSLFNDLLSNKYFLFFKNWKFFFKFKNNNLDYIYSSKFRRHKFLKKVNKYKFFIFPSKIWIWRYQSWIIVYSLLYLPDTNFFFKPKKLIYFDIFFNFYLNNIKLNSNIFFLKNFFFKKFFF